MLGLRQGSQRLIPHQSPSRLDGGACPRPLATRGGYHHSCSRYTLDTGLDKLDSALWGALVCYKRMLQDSCIFFLKSPGEEIYKQHHQKRNTAWESFPCLDTVSTYRSTMDPQPSMLVNGKVDTDGRYKIQLTSTPLSTRSSE